MSIKWSASNTEQWLGGYKLEVDVTSEEYQDSWQYDLKLENGDRISEIYGATIEDYGDGNYTVRGVDYWQDIDRGEVVRPVLIVEQGNLYDSSHYEPESSEPQQFDYVAQTENSINESNSIDVDGDFGGDIEAAIASAGEGQTVALGDKTYYTDGLFIDKNIVLSGSENTAIDGMNTGGSIIELGDGADGATIENLTLTNGNNGITGDRAENLTLQNLKINNIGINQPMRDGNNNTGIGLSHADGLVLKDSTFENIGRKGVGLGDTVGATISNLNVSGVNLAAQHAQSHDAAGIKLFNTHDVAIADNNLSRINAMSIWNDTTNATTISGNTVTGVGEDFVAPDFNSNVTIHGIYNEKSSNSVVTGNGGSALDGFNLYNATEFTTESMSLEGNDFGDSMAIGTTDYWVNEGAEKAIATTIDPDAANFDLFADEYYEVAVI